MGAMRRIIQSVDDEVRRITQSVDDENGNRWLDFIVGATPNLGVQIHLPPNLDNPFNIFWWGITEVDQLKQISQALSKHYEQMSEPGYFRSVCYGNDWKEVIENERNVELKVVTGTLNVRFEYVTDRDQPSKLITWARFHSFPRPSDDQAVESIGIMLPYRLFMTVEELIERFFRDTTLRPVPHQDFLTTMSRLRLEFPVSQLQ
jgi:hypothetical protein